MKDIILKTGAFLVALPIALSAAAEQYPSPAYGDLKLISPRGQSGQFVIAPTGRVVLSAVFDVSAYGAVGDGTTDNATAYSKIISAVATGAQGGRIDFPCGKFKSSLPLSLSVPNGKHISINGQGCTELFFPASDGIKLIYGNNASYASIADLKVTTGSSSSRYTAIWLTSAVVNTPQNASPSYIDHVSVNGSDGLGLMNYWGKGIFQDKVSFLNVDDFNFNGSSTLQGTGMLLQGDTANAEFSVVTNVSHSNFAFCAVGVEYGEYYQGLNFTENNITGCNRGIYSPPGSTLNLQASITANQFNNATSSIEFASEMPGAQIVGNTFLLHGYGIKTVGLINSTIIGNSFSAAAKPGDGNAINIGSSNNSAESVIIDGNACLSINSCITVASGAKGRASGNIWWNVATPYTNASSNFFQGGNIANGAQFASQAGSLSGVTFSDIVTVNNLLASKTAPTISSGFCTSPSIVVPNGTWTFRISVGSSCSTSSGVITMPTAANGWDCKATSGTAVASSVPVQDLTGSTATSITIRNYSRTTGAAANFTSGDVLLVSCVGQ
ncbi:glycosyl hydrolase family 28-related protein [Rhizobium sp. P44RR-XXIV]|uniref:glycosyl hydrolase family 28-related protein n=1 Tax=Rhizobium sp. P44RR-XXIV TaxID=1921145 RepID=UPI0009CC4F72|nr:glycosyl hydrolase family 28-related protein [Rhizobium sp. P44RR-XXIV]